MDEDTLHTNITTLKEMILDEQKLVTYVSLSKELCTHVNNSKFLMRKVIEDIRKNQPDTKLNVSFLISGFTEDNKARTTVSSEKDIESVRKTLKSVFFEHIYSVSRGQPSVDNVALLALNQFEDFPLCTGLIKSNSCIKRTTDEIGNLKTNSKSVVVDEKKPINPPPKKIKDDCKNGQEGTKSVTKVEASKSVPNIKSEIPSPKKDLSAKQKHDNKKNGNKNQKGIAGFFSKSNSVPSKKIINETTAINQAIGVKVEKESKKVHTDTEVEIMDVDEEISIKKEVIKKEIKIEHQNDKKNKPKNTKSLNEIKKNAKIDKKRKRVLHVSDSESDDEKNDPFIDEQVMDHESEDEIPPTPTVNTVKITSGMLNPKKKRKIIDKTYTDEDGYILTKKEEVYETCSDNDDEVVSKENVAVPQVTRVKLEVSPKGKKNGPLNPKKKISPPQKGKQATMMNFFKKK